MSACPATGCGTRDGAEGLTRLGGVEQDAHLERPAVEVVLGVDAGQEDLALAVGHRADARPMTWPHSGVRPRSPCWLSSQAPRQRVLGAVVGRLVDARGDRARGLPEAEAQDRWRWREVGRRSHARCCRAAPGGRRAGAGETRVQAAGPARAGSPAVGRLGWKKTAARSPAGRWGSAEGGDRLLADPHGGDLGPRERVVHHVAGAGGREVCSSPPKNGQLNGRIAAPPSAAAEPAVGEEARPPGVAGLKRRLDDDLVAMAGGVELPGVACSKQPPGRGRSTAAMERRPRHWRKPANQPRRGLQAPQRSRQRIGQDCVTSNRREPSDFSR